MSFVYETQVHFDELDPMQMLHNSRFVTHIERAITSWYSVAGRKWELNVADNPDQFHVVRDLRIEYLNPVIGANPIQIEVWVDHLGNTSCVYGFRFTSVDGAIEYARGNRTIVKVDPETRRPAPWTDAFREHHATILAKAS
jgi:acyl-CoA thioester hydrolase